MPSASLTTPGNKSLLHQVAPVEDPVECLIKPLSAE